jgi:hypothetical protein
MACRFGIGSRLAQWVIEIISSGRPFWEHSVAMVQQSWFQIKAGKAGGRITVDRRRERMMAHET